VLAAYIFQAFNPSDATLMSSIARQRRLNAEVDFLRKCDESPGTQNDQMVLRFQVGRSKELHGFVLHKCPDGVHSESRPKRDVE